MRVLSFARQLSVQGVICHSVTFSIWRNAMTGSRLPATKDDGYRLKDHLRQNQDRARLLTYPLIREVPPHLYSILAVFIPGSANHYFHSALVLDPPDLERGYPGAVVEGDFFTNLVWVHDLTRFVASVSLQGNEVREYTPELITSLLMGRDLPPLR